MHLTPGLFYFIMQIEIVPQTSHPEVVPFAATTSGPVHAPVLCAVFELKKALNLLCISGWHEEAHDPSLQNAP